MKSRRLLLSLAFVLSASYSYAFFIINSGKTYTATSIGVFAFASCTTINSVSPKVI